MRLDWSVMRCMKRVLWKGKNDRGRGKASGEDQHWRWKRSAGILERHGSTPLKTAATLAELVRRPELSYEALAELDPNRPELPEDVIEQININIKYDGYIRRQLQQVAQFKKMESRKLDENFDYSTVGSLRREAVQKLNLYKPANIGQASRIAGVSPADISVLLVHLEQSRHAGHGEEKKEL